MREPSTTRFYLLMAAFMVVNLLALALLVAIIIAITRGSSI